MENPNETTLRLILGDQLNSSHSWLDAVDERVTYVLMEVRTETDYAVHHIQKVVGFFSAMRSFAAELKSRGHRVIYFHLNDNHNLQSFERNLDSLFDQNHYSRFEYQLPDEYRLDILLRNYCENLSIPHSTWDTEHFFSTREELGAFFEGRKTFVMENFYRAMRKKHQVLMEGNIPTTAQWNYDSDNRQKLPKNHKPTAPLVFDNDVTSLVSEINATTISTMGNIEAKHFIWPVNRKQSLALLDFFVEECLPLFGTYQDAMGSGEWSLYHSRLSFAMNVKMISPKEVIDKAIQQWERHKDTIGYNQLEGFVRQIIGWREYMRGIYWLKMPGFASLNFLNHTKKLPDWYWTGKTKMNCVRDAVTQSLNHAYAHHIQRLMITGNFALLAGIHPDEVDAWYLGIYIDAIEWVEITNTRGMSQFADGGVVGTKPYVSSAAYIDKMSHYCGSCYYKKALKTGEKACPFNSLYWNFYDRHEDKLSKNPRIGMMYSVWAKMQPEEKVRLLEQAHYYLKHINEL